MYRNLAYLSRQQLVRLYTWDSEGKRIHVDMPYRPYYYREVAKGRRSDATSLYNTPLKRYQFDNEYKRRESIADQKDNLQYSDQTDIRLFENISPPQQFLIDEYGTQNHTEEFSKFPIKIMFLDIETYSPDAFPEPDKATDVVNVITLYDSLTNTYHTWGLNEYKPKSDDNIYYHCRSERDLLIRFVDYIAADYPDILTGWNSEFFDIPYLINRIKRVIGDEYASRLSPIDVIYSRELVSQFGKYNTRWHIKGLSCVDYLDVYKKFSVGLRESYKLDSIAEYELGEKKIDYGNTNLSSLADDDWELFVDYNVQDVRLLVKMEEKLRYIELLRMLAYTGLTLFENAMGTLNVITGASVIEARKTNRVVPTFEKISPDQQKYEGAYVGEPERGFQDQIVSFDVNSLYPNIMISLNLSPETKMGSFTKSGDKVILKKVTGTTSELDKVKFVKGVSDLGLSLTKANVLFSQKNKGIYPSIVDNFYNERVKIKKKITAYKRELYNLEQEDKNPDRQEELKDFITKLDIKQFTIKIFINTVYGYFGNKHAPMGDPDISRSITLTGQAIIKESNKILTQYVMDKCNLTEEDMKNKPCVLYNDTDSVYITIKHLTEHLGIPFTTKRGKVSKEVHNLVQDIEDHLNEKIISWGEKTLNSKDCRFMFKRECICDVGLFLQKKRYILHVLDDEGIPVNKFKYTGVEVVRTTMPAAIKPRVKGIIEHMLLSKDYSETNKQLNEVYNAFVDLPLEDIAFVMGISSYKTKKHSESGTVIDECEGFKTYKGMPIHVKGAYYYNTILKKLGLENKYEDIGSGDKVRYFYVKQPNQYGIKTFAYKYYFPEELKDIIVPDKELMFDKIVYSVIERLYEAVNWVPRKPNEIVQTDLFDLLQETS